MNQTRTVAIINPLPEVLSHFQRALVDNLSFGDGPSRVSAVVLDVPSAEMPAGSGTGDRMRAGVAFLTQARKEIVASGADVVVNLWPTFGYMDAALWRGLRVEPTVWTILHDVQPLRQQFGYWPQMVGPLRLGSPGRHRCVVHTSDAQMEAASLGLGTPDVLPHPLLPNDVDSSAGSREVLVFGQYKPARDLDLLERLGPALRADGLVPKVVGRGWPEIPGWDIEDRFVAEREVQPLLASAAVVLIPYKKYYQSGVALRALESGTPVVGLRNGFLTEYLGQDWPGLVVSDSIERWVEAIHGAVAVEESAVRTVVQEARSKVSAVWQDGLTRAL